MGELKRIASNSIILIAARILGMLAGLGTVLLLSRLLGLADLGVMMLCMSVSAVLSGAASLNIESVAIRYVPLYGEQGVRRKLAGFHACGILTILSFAAASAVVAGLGTLLTGYDLFGVFWRYGVFAAPLFSLIRLNAEVVSANGDVISAVLPRTMLRPVLLYAGLLAVNWLGDGLTLEIALQVFYGALASVAAIQFGLIVPRRLKDAAPSIRAWRTADFSEWKEWLAGGMRLVLPYLFIEYSTDIIVVAATLALSSPEIAVLGVLLRIVSLHRFITIAATQAAAPRIAQAWTRGETRRLHGLIAAIGLASLAVQMSAVLFHLVFGDFELSIFGDEFAGYSIELALLGTMAVVVAVYGQATRMAALIDLRGYLATLYIGALAALAAAVAGLGLLFGLMGVAIAVPVVWIGWSVALWRKVRSESGVDSSAVGAWFEWRTAKDSHEAAKQAQHAATRAAAPTAAE